MLQSPREVLPGFVVLEGIDGSGRSTQLKRIDASLGRRGIAHWTSGEPTEGPIGKLCRNFLGGAFEARAETVARLFAADRNEHLHGAEGAVARLARGELVVFDRYLFSSVAYQGMDCGLEAALAANYGFPLPELLIYFETDVGTAMRRVASRGAAEIFESHPIQERVRLFYEATLTAFASSEMRVERVDAGLPLDEVSRIVDSLLEEVIRGRAEGHTL